MRMPQRVVWTEGMFMAPQHLQQQDLYHEAFVSARVAALLPYEWGVVHNDIDSEALASGQFQIQKFFGILPDGLPVAFERGQSEAPSARAIDEHFGSSQRSLEVFLGIAKEREGIDSYAQSAEQDGRRFEVANRPVPDLMASHSVVPVAFARGRVRILFGTEPRDDFECIQLADLVRQPTGGLALSETYIPPCLRVSAAPPILAGVRRLLKLVVAKQRELADTRKHRDASSLEFTASDVTRFLQLSALNGAIPVLTHIVDTGDLHPLQVYLLLLQLTGQLCTFDAQGDPSTLPKFQFTKLQKSFEELFGRATSMLRTVALEQCVAIRLEVRQGGLQVGKLDDERLGRCNQFILGVRSVLPEQQVADQFPRLSKIASATEIHGLVQAATPGVPLQVTFRPPPEVPVRPGTVYFSVAISDPYWKNAVRDRSIAIYLPQALDPARTQLELLGVPTASG